MILAILQARTTSSRLPGKVLKPLMGKAMILRQIERIRRSKRIQRLVLATSTDATDDPLAALCLQSGVECFRGSLADVLDRFYQAAAVYAPESVVRLTGDCPLADPAVIDAVIEFYLSGGYDYASNAVEPTFPDGLDTEIFRFSALRSAWQNARTRIEREHVTPYLYDPVNKFKIGHYKNTIDLSALRWTVDEPLDFELVSKIYESLYPRDPAFGMASILKYLDDHPELKSFNTQHRRNEGLARSLNEGR